MSLIESIQTYIHIYAVAFLQLVYTHWSQWIDVSIKIIVKIEHTKKFFNNEIMIMSTQGRGFLMINVALLMVALCVVLQIKL